MDTEDILRQRKEQLMRLFRKDRHVSAFSVIALISFLFGLLVLSGVQTFIGVFSQWTWFLLGILALGSAALAFFEKKKLSFYPLLAWVVFIAVRIRTRNLAGLRDITTGSWTLGPDLDPFLFLRWAKSIVQNGSLMALDTMRSVPLGSPTNEELILHPYLIAWFHNVASIFGSESVTQSAVLYPIFFFAITVVAFFFMVRRIFVDNMGGTKANVIAVVSAFFLSVLPSLLARTIAGIPEKESAAFFFMFTSFYFFLTAWKAKSRQIRYVNAVLAGVFTAGMALVWGGFVYVFVTIALLAFAAFMLGMVNKERFYSYTIWLSVAVILMIPFRAGYSISGLATSSTTGFAFITFAIMGLHFAIYDTRLKKYFQHEKLRKIPPQFISLGIVVVLGAVFSSVLFGPSFIGDKYNDVIQTLVTPKTDRLGITVAENRQPFFNEWASSFGPTVNGIPVFFWTFFIGSIVLFYQVIRELKGKDRALLTGAYTIFLIGIIFSRYRSNSLFNGENAASLALYFGSVIIFIGALGFTYYQYYKRNEHHLFKKLDIGMLFIFAFFFFSIVSARGAVRLIMVLVPSASIIASYFGVTVIDSALKRKSGEGKLVGWTLSVLVVGSLLFAGVTFYNITNSSAQGYVPSSYNQQWQKAMSWVRENTQEDSVFGHWWDYGYWVQSIGERATVLDGGNQISYWNHLMGRHALTGTSSEQAAEFLYAHDTTHFLIDSTDIGKYSAYSSIGSDVDYDRASFIPTFLRDQQQTLETKEGMLYAYQGGTSLDQDIIYEDNGSEIFLPSGAAGVGAFLVELGPEGEVISQPEAVFVYQGRQYTLPLRYSYSKEFKDHGSGVESGLFIFPSASQSGGQLQLDPYGAMLYLSPRTVKSQVARLYLYGQEDEYFSFAHSEDDFIVSQIKAQNPSFDSDFIHFRGFRGPIKIWEISYPDDITLKEEFLDTRYPPELRVAR